MMATSKSLEDGKCKSHSIMRKKEDIMFKRVMIALFAISVVAMLWTEANADCPLEFTYCVDVGGSQFCGCLNEGSIKASGSITCNPNLGTCLPGPFKYKVEIFGNEPTSTSGACGSNPQCNMGPVTVTCNGGPPHVTTLEAGKDVNFPLLGTGNCKSGTCETVNGPVDCLICETNINLQNCQGQSNVPNCCFGPDCCPPGTKTMSFTPDSPRAFDARTAYSQNPGAKTGPQTVIVESADCSLDSVPPRTSTCNNSCTFSGPCEGGVCDCVCVEGCGD